MYRASNMQRSKKEKALKIVKKLQKEYPNAHIHLNYDTPLQLLLATILAAQCTDAKVNEVTPYLWKAFPTAEAIAQAEPEELHKILKPTGFFRQKTESIKNVCNTIKKKYDGQVPESLEELTSLPGVGRKTANVVLANAYDKQTIPVDTHVKRVSNRLGLACSGNPDKIEKELCRLIPKEEHTLSALVLGEHGRNICKSRKPQCAECVVFDLCDYAQYGQK